MRKLEQLQQYELILTVRSPLFVGSGQSYQRTEYIYNRRSNRVSVLHRNRFIHFLAEKIWPTAMSGLFWAGAPTSTASSGRSADWTRQESGRFAFTTCRQAMRWTRNTV